MHIVLPPAHHMFRQIEGMRATRNICNPVRLVASLPCASCQGHQGTSWRSPGFRDALANLLSFACTDHCQEGWNFVPLEDPPIKGRSSTCWQVPDWFVLVEWCKVAGTWPTVRAIDWNRGWRAEYGPPVKKRPTHLSLFEKILTFLLRLIQLQFYLFFPPNNF